MKLFWCLATYRFPPFFAALQRYLETEVECIRRLRERARGNEAKAAAVTDEVVQYEGLGMPILVSPFFLKVPAGAWLWLFI